jgi:hypothetical protein
LQAHFRRAIFTASGKFFVFLRRSQSNHTEELIVEAVNAHKAAHKEPVSSRWAAG